MCVCVCGRGYNFQYGARAALAQKGWQWGKDLTEVEELAMALFGGRAF